MFESFEWISPISVEEFTSVKMRPTSRMVKEVLLYIIVTLVINIILISPSEAQIISHELRRLAVSTNQFGIDALKALDRIEPPDKVIVFSPICLSSSLMMIMMGSSKYQVVSSFKQALYVWSMKPSEINLGFKDIFEHIGLNQHQSNSKAPAQIPLADSRARNHQKRSPGGNYDNNKFPESYLSLPKLMRMKEMMDRSLNDNSNFNWWKSINSGSHQANSSRLLSETIQSPSSIELDSREPLARFNQTTRTMRDAGESSQMNAISNIYIQRGLNMNYNYNLLLRQYYKTVIHPVDFFRNSEETRQHINSLVSSNTEGKIKDLVKKATFENVTQPKIMIISTFHFRATLDVQIKSQLSSEEQQVGITNNSKNEIISKNNQQPSSKLPTSIRKGKTFIETEESLLKFGMFSNLDCSVVEIPFNNRLVSLIIVMPNHHNSTELLITRLSAQVLSDMVNSLIVRKISIEIPVIKFDRGPINVDGLLRELGLGQYFFGNRLQSSTETGLNKWMRPADIVHETSIDIGTINPNFPQTEDRLKVGAHDEPPVSQSSIVTTTPLNINPNNKNKRKRRARNDVNHIKLDKPFLYFVFDSINGLVLTMGRIRQ